MRKHHLLKILPIYYDLVREGRKTFEVRRNDRGFQNADTVTLREFDSSIEEWEDREGYSGREQSFGIGYVLHLDDVIAGNKDFVVFSLLEDPT